MISRSPYGDEFKYAIDDSREKTKIKDFVDNKKTIVVQGLGFVGGAMAAALSKAKDKQGGLIYNVIGVDFPDENNYWKIARINKGKPLVFSSDINIDVAYKDAYENKNLMATYSHYAYSVADVVVVDIHLDVEKKNLGDPYDYVLSYDKFKESLKTVADNILENTLVIIETTVPPGTTEKVIHPIFLEIFKRRNLDINKLYLVHSYERVMPGINYLNSITNFYRVYSGINDESEKKAKDFFESFINTKDYPLCKLSSTTASEMAKVLENSFRATNIAFIQEWTEYAHRAKVNLFEITKAIRVRPTHKSIMSPGFGVGGYCLPKDSLFADWAFTSLFGAKVHLEMSLKAIAINDLMPNYTFNLLKQKINDLSDKYITILGISYLNDIADTRFSPAEYFYNKCLKEGASVNIHDSLVSFWKEKNLEIDTDIEHLRKKNHDIIVFTVRHKEYLFLTAEDILSIFKGLRVVIDANNIISDDIAVRLAAKGITMIGVGKGHWEDLK